MMVTMEGPRGAKGQPVLPAAPLAAAPSTLAPSPARAVGRPRAVGGRRRAHGQPLAPPERLLGSGRGTGRAAGPDGTVHAASSVPA
ncbi:MAG: hypothetical protein HY332_05645, partial [Chloroflexi bacterium]|nr:hypothetical protein [Chloroflexota bacterium]